MASNHTQRVGPAFIVHNPSGKKDSTIVFVPFFMGHPKQLLKHVEMVTKLGFRSVTFELTFNWRVVFKFFSLRGEKHWGLLNLWAHEIESVLDQVKGPKILYGFSGPSACCVAAIGNRRAKDISAAIFDSGPFFRIFSCNWNYFSHQAGIQSSILKLGLTTVLTTAMGFRPERWIRQNLKKIPQGFRILQIRGWNDRLVSLHSYDAVFRGMDHLKLELLNIPEGDHLDGLTKFPEEYRARVSRFLSGT